MDKTFEKLESEVMLKILAEEPAVAEALAQQYKNSLITSREFTGVGFFTNFEVANETLALADSPSFELGSVQATISGLEFGAGFVLYVRDGLIKMLEAYSYDEPWPEQILSYQLK